MRSPWNILISHSFDSWSRNYDNDIAPSFKRRGTSYASIAKEVSKYFPNSDSNRILDLGCGTGKVGESIKPLGYELHGGDISEGMIIQAEKTNAYESLSVCSADNLPYNTDSFDSIVSCFMFHSVMRPGKALLEMRRVLRPQGTLIIVDLFRTRKRIPVASSAQDNIHSIMKEHGALSRYCSRTELATRVEKKFHILDSVNLDGIRDSYKESQRNFEHGLLSAQNVK